MSVVKLEDTDSVHSFNLDTSEPRSSGGIGHLSKDRDLCVPSELESDPFGFM